MYRDFYTTLAQVLPVLLLALMFDSGFLARLSGEARLPRRKDRSGGVWFWTKGRVRAYVLTVLVVTILSTGLSLAVLAGLLQDSSPLRIALAAGAALVLATLLTRVAIDVIAATGPSGKDQAGAP